MLLAILGSAAAWAGTGSYARTETVVGQLVPSRAVVKLLAARPGVVSDWRVAEGQRVAKGQMLGFVTVEQASGAGAVATGALAALGQQRAALARQLALQTARERGESHRLAMAATGARAQLAALDSQAALQAEQVAAAEAELRRVDPVVARGFMTRQDQDRRAAAWRQRQQEAAQLAQQRAALEASLAANAAERDRLAVDIATARAQLTAALAELDRTRAAQAGEQGYRLVAPVAGRITNLAAGPGRFVDARLPLLAIVPEGAALHAELLAPSRAAGFVRPGQTVRLLYDAFPYQRFGSFEGRIETVGRTVVSPADLDPGLDIREPVFRIRTRLVAQTVRAEGETIPLQPGMTLRASIVLERRSFVDWLLAPLNAVNRRG
ncbi:hypothetical protein IP88_09790 [alpha proteobacterium AAP81b]|nr:hypothetical protein IP88_09790 [alpha proteobacterium AAP81b]